MAATNYTPIQLYRTTTAAAVPSAANLAAGELAINLTDEKLYFKNAGGTVTLLASSASAANVGTVTSVSGTGTVNGLTLTGTVTSSGSLTLGGTLTGVDLTTQVTGTLPVANGGTGVTTSTGSGANVLGTSPTFTTDITAPIVIGGTAASSTLILRSTSGTGTSDAIIFQTASQTERGRFTTAGYLEATHSAKVVAVGNTGTAQTLNLAQGNVFTATLTGNCTFTLSGANANSSRGSSFTLILTNDGTAGRTVAWAGGNFRFPGGAATLSRTTTANATDIWVFFTPDNGTTWYGNISMKDMKA